MAKRQKTEYWTEKQNRIASRNDIFYFVMNTNYATNCHSPLPNLRNQKFSTIWTDNNIAEVANGSLILEKLRWPLHTVLLRIPYERFWNCLYSSPLQRYWSPVLQWTEVRHHFRENWRRITPFSSYDKLSVTLWRNEAEQMITYAYTDLRALQRFSKGVPCVLTNARSVESKEMRFRKSLMEGKCYDMDKG